MKPRYEAKGSVRGSCGHQHATIGGAYRCAVRDNRACRRLGQGCYSDRQVYRTDCEPMTAAEKIELEDAAAAVAAAYEKRIR